jgi:hypothetical protein
MSCGGAIGRPFTTQPIEENTMIRGTRILTREEARRYVEAITTIRGCLHCLWLQ